MFIPIGLIFSLDRWNIWKDYINSVFHLMCSQNLIENNHVENHISEENDLEVIDDTPEKAHEFICRLVENGCDNGKYHLIFNY